MEGMALTHTHTHQQLYSGTFIPDNKKHSFAQKLKCSWQLYLEYAKAKKVPERYKQYDSIYIICLKQHNYRAWNTGVCQRLRGSGCAVKGSMWGPGADGTLLYLNCISVNTLAGIVCKISVCVWWRGKRDWQRVLGSFYILAYICMLVYNDLKTNGVYIYRGKKLEENISELQ